MWLRRSSSSLRELLAGRRRTLFVVSRFFSQIQSSPSSSSSHSSSSSCSSEQLGPLTYLEGFPEPDPKYSETIVAIPREKSGRLISTKERRAGRVPSILFEQENGETGGNKVLISVKTKQIRKLLDRLGQPFFLSRLYHLDLRPDFESQELIQRVRVLPRNIDVHAGTDEIMNITFMKAPSHANFKVDVPLIYRGEDACPGLKKGAYLNIIRRKVKFLCPADIVPLHIDVDLSELDVGQKLLVKDLKVHPAITHCLDESWPVCNLRGTRVSQDSTKK